MIAFAPRTAASAVARIGAVDHASRHLIKAGVFGTVAHGSKEARQAFSQAAVKILENPTRTFDRHLRGTAVKGFVGEINGVEVVIYVAKENKGRLMAGDVASAAVISGGP